jgi:thiamine-monophosphate kinase
MGEFEIINKFFRRQVKTAVLGIGDDCALFSPSDLNCIAVTTDTLVNGVHFFPETDPFLIGWKSLAVNISDLAAMGAKPKYFTLALTLPENNLQFIESFAKGIHTLSERYEMELIGGDTTRGNLVITITAFGEVPQNLAVKRSGAKPGDDIWVTGDLGAPALALNQILNKVSPPGYSAMKLNAPNPRVDIGINLRNTASAMIDISDGFLADLEHILDASNVGCEIFIDQLPLAADLSVLEPRKAEEFALTGGDEYELCFTAHPKERAFIRELADKASVNISLVGSITKETRIKATSNNRPYKLPLRKGYTHF